MSLSIEGIRPATSANDIILRTVKDASRVSGFPVTRLYHLMSAGEIETRKIGRRTMILARSLEDYIDRQPAAVIRMSRAA